MPPPSPLIPGALLSREEWMERGVSPRRLAHGDLTRVFPGIYTPTHAPASLTALCHRLQTRVLPGSVISHGTAAALLGIPLPWWHDEGIGLLSEHARRTVGGRIVPGRLPAPDRSTDATGPARRVPPVWSPPPLHCSLPPGGRHSAGPRVRVHHLRSCPHHDVDGLRIAHPVEILRELAGVLPLDDVVVIADHLLGPSAPLGGWTLTELRSLLESGPHREGNVPARAALALARDGVESPGETRLRLLIVRAGFPEPVPNVSVPDPDAPGRTRRLDLRFPGLMVGAEYQGDIHRTDRHRWRDDEARRDSLASAGWELRYATADDIAHPHRFLSGLRRAFLRAGAEAPPESVWAGPRGRELGRTMLPPLTDGRR